MQCKVKAWLKLIEFIDDINSKNGRLIGISREAKQKKRKFLHSKIFNLTAS